MQILDAYIQKFINSHINSSASDLMLKASSYPEWDMKAIAQQLVGKQIAKKKLPTWFQNNEILYPVRLSMEQCSSETTAKYKTTIINSGRGIDLTGGYGVDTIFLSKQSESLIYCERNEDLASLVNHNFKALNQHNCEVHVGDGVEYLKNLKSENRYNLQNHPKIKKNKQMDFLYWSTTVSYTHLTLPTKRIV